MLTSRLERLKSWVLTQDGRFYHRHLLWTESFRASEGEPIIIRRAKAFAHMLDHIPIEIGADELIVGRHPKGEPSEQERERLAECDRYWVGKTPAALAREGITEEERAGLAEVLYTGGFMTGHMTVDNAKVLRLGLAGIKREVEERRGETGADDEARDFYQAALITLDAAMRFAGRYAQEAGRLAAEADPVRKQELSRIAEICRRVPAHPARDFWEALQAVWLIHLMAAMENGESHGCFCPGHVDRYAWPFYEADLAAGRLTREQAEELLACWFIKFNEFCPKGPPQVLMVGGQYADGADASNDLTRMCLGLCRRLRLLHPSLALCYHHGIAEDVLSQAVALMGMGMGFPSVFSDEVIIPGLVAAGAPREEAVEYIPGACVEISVVGKSNPWVASGYINFAKCLEHVLYDSGPEGWDSFESLFRAFEAEVARAVELNWRTISRHERAMAELSPFPFLSTLVEDCIARGRDITNGGARYNPTHPEGVGLANVADGLAAIKRLVFEERSLSRDELLAALRSNFEGSETLRRRLLAQPKWGNDDDYVDAIGVRIAETFYREVARYRNSRGGPYQPGFLCWVQHEPLGRACGATPDGRFAGTVLADAIGAAQGRDRRGPTAVIRSVTKFDHTPALGGLVLNLKFSPALFDDSNLPKMAALLRAYFELGGFQVQVNVVDRETLRDAQRHPDRYENLIVRVAGWSAYFTTLCRELQDDIIARTEHGVG